MKKFKFKKIDAFATEKSDGNPAGYIHLNSQSDITDAEMQKIAKELKGYINEVGFIYHTADNEFSLKYYSPEREVDFCGHATIAIMYDLIQNNPVLQKYDFLKIKTNRGELKVENRITSENAVYIMSPVPEEKKLLIKLYDIAENMEISQDDIDVNLPVSVINAGLTTLLFPIKNLSLILGISPNIEKLKNFCNISGVDIIEVFTLDVSDKSNDFRTRVFAPTFGYLEDPATGSGNSAFGYYLIKNKKFNREIITIEQNGDKDRFNIVKLQKQFDENGIERVLFGGGAITRIEGEYILY
jgi:PhzF family phenazine biosynthesis protein